MNILQYVSAQAAAHIVSFSGGQTSGRMLRMLMDDNPTDFLEKFEIVFNNTGKEHDKTLDFVNEVAMRWGVPITWLEYCRKDNEHSFNVVTHETAARRMDDASPFAEMLAWVNALPNVRARSCSGHLKVRTTRRYLQARGTQSWHDYIGIRADEAHRTIDILAAKPRYITARFPLCDVPTTLKQVNDWWNAQPFKLEIPNYMGNCDLCFLKAKWKRLAIMEQEPESAAWWIEQERKMRAKGVTGDGALWISGKSYEGTLADAIHPQFDFNEEDIACSCAVGGYRDEP